MARVAFLGDVPQDGSFETKHEPSWQIAKHCGYSAWKCSGCHFAHELPVTNLVRPTHCMRNEDGK